ncbi:MAG: flavin reductase family protein [Desulfurococcaceae archaeon]
MIPAFRLLYPLRTYLLVTGRYGEEVDVMAIDWVTIVSVDPFIIAISVAPTRYSYGLIERHNEFVLSVPGLDILRDVWITGSERGPGKLAKTSLLFEPGLKVKTPIIKNAIANLECRVLRKEKIGDHVLVLAEIVAYTYKKEAYEGEFPKLTTGFIAHIGRNKFTTFIDEIYEA